MNTLFPGYGNAGYSEHDLESFSAEVVEAFSGHVGLQSVPYEVRQRVDGPLLVLFLANPSERFFLALEDVMRGVSSDNPFFGRTTLKYRSKLPKDRLSLPEVDLFRKTVLDSLTTTRDNFDIGRYISTVANAENDISSESNTIVFGRRGAGKSSLLAFHAQELTEKRIPHAWVDMQMYSVARDLAFIADVIFEICDQLLGLGSHLEELQAHKRSLSQLSGNEREKTEALAEMLPAVRRTLASIARQRGKIVIFLDDLHVVRLDMQPRLLEFLYAIAKGVRIFLKISGIEQRLNTWDVSKNRGLESPHDAQVVRLDSNLTMPHRSRDHITRILDRLAEYSGLATVSSICHEHVVPRLVWVAAGVPRDALNVFTQAIVRASVKGQTRVSIGSINESGSIMTDEKLGRIELDASDRAAGLRETLEQVRDFCIKEKKKNAFLVEIRNDSSEFNNIRDLIGLRFLHVLHDGITPKEASRRFVALLLDYGFYIGTRTARSVDLFKKDLQPMVVEELRKLPRYTLE